MSDPSPTQPPRANRLARCSSPYLLQHAYNPVDWFPWGDEAFAEARRRDVPILLSVGYSTCYWCHVMERESFESAAIADVLNANFVCVKVDREEHPDVDEIYMAALVTTTGQGGWPMSCFLDPRTLRPFFCGTYYPYQPMPGLGNRPTFPRLLSDLSRAWREQRGAIEKQAAAIADAVGEQLAPPAPAQLGVDQIVQALDTLMRIFDPTHGGFGGAPKFPQPVFLEFLLAVRPIVDESSRPAVDRALRTTLDAMTIGGIRDHLAGGFHRYSVDAHWTVPHFEKMLYDNAQLLAVYAEASRVFEDAWYADAARDTAEYVLREMTSPEGGFFSAQDAETAGREGRSYVWMREEIVEALPDRALADAACAVYGLDAGANFRDPHHPADPPASVLRLSERPDRRSRDAAVSVAMLRRVLTEARASLLARRARREQPRLDDKTIAAWNGLMIGALARAGVALAEPRYIAAAARAGEFVLSRLATPDGALVRARRGSVAGVPGVLEDYAFVAAGLLALHRAQPAARRWLAEARRVCDRALAEFADTTGTLFDARADRPDLFIRPRSTHDGALPSAISTMIHNLLDLAEFSADAHDMDRALSLLAGVSGSIADSPVGAINATRALLRALTSGEKARRHLAAESGATTTTTRPGAVAAAPPTAHHADDAVVEVFASVERVTVARDTPGVVTLRVRVADGIHLVAAQPDTAAPVVPFRAHVLGGSGVVAYADYPEGERFTTGAHSLRVYRGEFDLRVVLEAHAEWSGRPILCVSFQACTDSACLAPQTREIDVAIDRA